MALAAVAVIRSWAAVEPDVFDRWAFALAVYIALTNIPVILSRPATYLNHINLELSTIAVLYAMLPDRLWYRVLPPVILSAGSLILFFTVKLPTGIVGSISIVLAYLIINLLGIMISSAFYRYRRTSFFAAEEINAAYLISRDSDLSDRLFAMARALPKNGLLKMYNNPFDQTHFNEPGITGVDLGGTPLKRALYDRAKKALIVSTMPAKSGGTGGFKIIRLDPAKNYELFLDGKYRQEISGVKEYAVTWDGAKSHDLILKQK